MLKYLICARCYPVARARIHATFAHLALCTILVEERRDVGCIFAPVRN